MRRTNKILIGLILIATMFLGIGYAAIENITLDIKGSITAEPPRLTNENIGDYIDLGNNIVGTESTTDDWRVLYVDEESDKVYVILANLLPNSTGYAANAGLVTGDETLPYAVWSETGRDAMLTAFTTSSNWEELANGISGATVTGTPTKELLLKSYNTVNNKDSTNETLSSSEKQYDLYKPVDAQLEYYWLATANPETSYWMYLVGYGGAINYNAVNRRWLRDKAGSLPNI